MFSFVFLVVLGWGINAQGGGCPAVTEVTKLEGSTGFQKKGPYDLKSITHASATPTDKGLVVILSNAPVDAKTAAPKLPLPPLIGKGKVSLILSFENKDSVAAGIYQPANFTDPNYIRSTLTFGFEGGGMADSTTLNQGTAQISELSADRVCGSFNLHGTPGAAVGKFTAKILK